MREQLSWRGGVKQRKKKDLDVVVSLAGSGHALALHVESRKVSPL